MASREDNPIWLDAEETIRTLFHDRADNDWLRLEQKRVIQTPSKAVIEDFDVKECCEIRAELQKGFKHIFEHTHVNTFWEDLVFKLKRAGGIHPVASRKRQNEDQLVASMIHPTLKKVVNSISIIPGISKCTNCNGQQPEGNGAVSSHSIIQDKIKTGNASGKPASVDATIQISNGKCTNCNGQQPERNGAVSSHSLIEDKIKTGSASEKPASARDDTIQISNGKCTNCNGQQLERNGAVSSHLVIQDEIKTGNTSGKPPSVDATIQISDGVNFYVLIPVEIKVEIKEQHQYQIAAYVTKMSTAKELENKVVIGILMDKEFFKLVFSPYKSKTKAIPLPIVYVSPLIRWKESSPQTLLSVLPAALLVIACTCYFRLDRIECDEDLQILQIAGKLLENRHKIKPIQDDVLVMVDDLLKISQKQQKDIAVLQTEIEDLKKQIKQNGALTDSQGSSTSSTTT